MTDEEITRIDERSKSNSHRIDRLEKDNEAIHDLAISVKVLATKQETANGDIKEIKQEVTAIKAIPADRWRSLIGYIIAAIASSGVGMLIAQIFK